MKWIIIGVIVLIAALVWLLFAKTVKDVDLDNNDEIL